MKAELKRAEKIDRDINITESEIKELESKLTDKEVQEFADDYGLTLEKARHDLAEYILYNTKL